MGEEAGKRRGENCDTACAGKMRMCLEARRRCHDFFVWNTILYTMNLPTTTGEDPNGEPVCHGMAYLLIRALYRHIQLPAPSC